MRKTHPRDHLECAVWSHRRSGSRLVGLVCAYPILSRLGRLNICLRPYLLRISLAVAPQYHREIHGGENATEVRRLLQLLHSIGCLNLTTNHFIHPREELSNLMTRILKSLRSNRNRLYCPIKVVVAVVLQPCFNPALINLHINLNF